MKLRIINQNFLNLIRKGYFLVEFLETKSKYFKTLIGKFKLSETLCWHLLGEHLPILTLDLTNKYH